MSDLALVFSTFNPTPSLIETVRGVAPQHPIVVVDDGGGDPHDVFPRLLDEGARVLRRPTNDGIAAALNAAIAVAFEDGAAAVVTFDQDSTPSPDTLRVLHATWKQASSAGQRVSGVVPAQFAEVRQTRSDDALPVARRVIQSGMLIPREAFDSVGGFDEALFIDLVDTDYELRSMTLGYRIIAAPTRIDHELGRPAPLRPFSPLPPTISTMVSTPFRYYYRMRNRLILTRRYLRTAPLRMVTDLAIDLAYFALVAASARPRRLMAAVLFRGAVDGCLGRGGRAPAKTQVAAARISWSVAK
ncbi:hypothetical protein ASF87_12395 [Microbacterium sp. Leaf161]|uniref:glycosyltransferase n=1 Tax=Microbacterium sp. Leaf161 TaxID=1736281 RepID=UPI0006F45A0B|nr:glycosyltransferase [Microbacterium sp. Leaf161]KQR49529.1 hypothetical protein ASF87_12395 [Microbacterium sp. Leaf161]